MIWHAPVDRRAVAMTLRLVLAMVLVAGCGVPSPTAGVASPTPSVTIAPLAAPQPSGAASPSPTVSVVATVPGATTPAVILTASSVKAVTTAAPVDNWPTYHRDNARTGADAAVQTFAPPVQSWQSETLDGDIYAEPLVVGGKVLVATTNDTVYSLDAATGQIAWQQHLGEPVPRSQLPCGDIQTTGITGTPVVDVGRGLLYAVTYVQPLKHELVALDLATGAVHFRQPIDPPGIDVAAHQQRAALIESQNQIYVALGGLFGDCGNYHGWLVAASADDGSVKARYQVPTQREGAIWAPSGPAVDAAGNIYAATGNGSSTSESEFDYGDTLLRLSPALQLADWFAPSNWVDLNRTDADIGSVGPALLDGGTIFQIGKSGVGYLLRADHLGHENGQAYQGPVCGAAFGGTAYLGYTLYVPCTDGLVALKVDGSTAFSVQWKFAGSFAGPPIIAGGAVWTIFRTGQLVALAPPDGQVLARISVGAPTHFATPSASGSRLFVPAASRIVAFSLG